MPTTPRRNAASEAGKQIEEEGVMNDITGARTAKLRYPCPIRLIYPEQECGERYNRVYDVKRHLKGGHGVELEDLQVRVLLSRALQKVVTGSEVVNGAEAGATTEAR